MDKSDIIALPLKGLEMNICAVDLFPRRNGWRLASPSSFSNAETRPAEFLNNLAADSSARYSLLLDIANWMIAAIKGVTTANTIKPTMLSPSLSLPPKPPKMAAHLAMKAT